MPGLCVDLSLGWLEINSFNLANQAFCCYDLFDLMMGADLKGKNGSMPNAPGVFPNPSRWTETTYDLPILIAGEVDSTGAVYGDGSIRGFQRNIMAIRNAIVDPTGAATLPSVFHTPDLTDAPGDVQVLRLIRGQIVEGNDYLTGSSGLAMKGVLRVRYPGGGPIFP